jgi:hypothetical protein
MKTVPLEPVAVASKNSFSLSLSSSSLVGLSSFLASYQAL